MKTQTTRDDLISIRGQIGQRLTKMETSDDATEKDKLATFRAIYAILDFLIRKTWGI